MHIIKEDQIQEEKKKQRKKEEDEFQLLTETQSVAALNIKTLAHDELMHQVLVRPKTVRIGTITVRLP